MTTLKESDQVPGEGTDESSRAVVDTECDWPSLMPWRDHVDALLDISEETFYKEQEPYEYHCLSGWEEAVEGWGRVAPIAGIFQAQRRGKKLKIGEPEYHCLLCVDMKLPDLDTSVNTPESCCKSQVDPQETALNKTIPSSLLTKCYSQTTRSSPEREAPECPVLCALQTATHNLLLREKMVEESSPPQHHHLDSKCPIIWNRLSNATLAINSFTVLPPVKTPRSKPQKINDQACNCEAAPGCNTVEGKTLEASEDSVISPGKSRGVERGEERRTDTVAQPELPKDTYSASLTSKYCTCQRNHRLLSAFCVSVPKRYEGPFSTISYTVPHTNHPTGRHLKQPFRTSSGYVRHTRPEQPQLPILLGTRVPMPASAQRLL